MSDDVLGDMICRNCVAFEGTNTQPGNCKKRSKDTTPLSSCSLFEQKEGKDFKINNLIIFFQDKKDLAQQFIKIQPIFYDKSKLWWLWNFTKFRWEMIDETDLLNLISKASDADTIKSKDRTEIIESLKQAGRENKPEEGKPTWVQFKENIIDIESGERLKASPDYFVTNPIPWDLGETTETPAMDKIFEEWVGKEYVETLYQIISYCLLPHYPLNRLFCFMGEGMNGKSKFLELVTRFVGIENTTSTELDVLLNSRFEITRLHKKLVCQMGETNFNEMKQTAIIKRLTGQDLIGFEYKNKDLFEEYNYAKILISTNNLPTTTDKTLGFYRRWLIIDFPHKFSEKKDILSDIPEEEYNNLATKSIEVLHKLLKTKEFNKEGTPEERGTRYEEKSNPFDKFMKDKVKEDADGHIYKFEFKKAIDDWCIENRFRQLTDSFIKQKMREIGVEDSKMTVTEEWYKSENELPKRYNAWIGISWEVSRGVQDVKGVPLRNTHVNLSEVGVTGMTGLDTEEVIDDKAILPMEHKSDKKPNKATYLENNTSGELFDLEKAIGIDKVKKYLKEGIIFEEKPGRYRSL